MSRLLYSKKCSAPFVAVFFVILFVAVGVMTVATNTGKPFAASDTEEMMYYISTIGLPILCLLVAAVMIGCIVRYSKAYIEIYDDHIEGVGVNSGFFGKLGNTASKFHYTPADHYTVTLDGSAVCIDCNGAKHYLNFSAQDAKEVYDVLNGKTTSAPSPQSPNTVTVTCPKCQMKCRYPVGHGDVVLTCPKCGCKIRARV